MATQQERLLALARSVAAARAEDPAIEAILLTGSVAQGRADGVSDVDMMLYYRELPTPERFEELKEAALASGGGIYGYDPAEGMACYHFFDGVKVDFGHGTSAELEERLDGFLEKPDVKDTTTQIVMSGVATGLPLHGAEKLRGWQERLRHLPESYWEEVVKGHLRFAPLAVLTQMGTDRRDYALVYELILRDLGHLLNIWCGLSRVIPPGKVKGIAGSVAKLSVLPERAGERAEALFTAQPAAAVEELQSLIHETLALVNRQMPAIETGPVRSFMRTALRVESAA